MAGGIWEALGAALQQGVGTYNTVSQQQKAQAENEARLKMQQEQQAQEQAYRAAQLKMQQDQFANEQADRQRKILSEAIQMQRPDQAFSEDFIGQVQRTAPDLMQRINQTPGMFSMGNVQTGLGASTADNPLGLTNEAPTFSQAPTRYTKQASMDEEAQQIKLDAARRQLEQQKSFEGMLGNLTPDQKQRLAVENLYPNIGSANTIFGTPPPNQGAQDEALVRSLMANPNAWANLPSKTKDRIAPALAAAGFKFEKPPFEEAVAYKKERDELVNGVAQELLDKADWSTTGFVGGLTSGIWNSPAYDWNARLEKLKANIAFAELTAMRLASKTGGALGQVSDTEGRLLASTRAALAQGQSPGQIREELQKLVHGLNRLDVEREKILAAEGYNPNAPKETPEADATTAPAGAQPSRTGTIPQTGAAVAPKTTKMTWDQVVAYAEEKGVAPAVMAKELNSRGIKVQLVR